MTPFDLAQRFIGISELPGTAHAPLIQWWLSLCGMGDNSADEVPWCSGFPNGIAWILRLPRSKSAAARSWLGVGRVIERVEDAEVGDVMVLKRGGGEQPDATVMNAPGHVGFFAGRQDGRLLILGGNQGNKVSIASFEIERLLGIRRLT